MLTIPESIKTLYKTDGVRKNFRVHFPNGEMEDITNANVVQESVRFTESLCSQDVFKFGLTEASMIEFETVGVANMYGMTIECSKEIDTSSLTAAQIAEIEADPGDGELVLAADSDIGYGFYRIPYGTFHVDSCPRNHGAMTHRKVTAYSTISGGLQNNPYELRKLRTGTSTLGNYKPSIPMLAYAAIGAQYPEFIKALNIKKATSLTGFQFYDQQIRSEYFENASSVPNPNILFTISARRAWIYFTGPTGSGEPQDALYSMDFSGYSQLAVDDAKEWAKTAIDNLTAGADGDLAATIVADALKPDQALSFFYPYYVDSALVQVPYTNFIISVQYFNTQGAAVTETKNVIVYTTTPALKQYAFSPDVDIRADIGPTLLGSVYHKFINSYSIQKLVNGWLELNGLFGAPSRADGFRMAGLDNSDPVEIVPGDYSECWWDEYDVAPIGTVRYSFGEGSQAAEYVFGDGASVYDMTDNYALQNMADASPATIEALLAETFVPRVQDVVYTPVDLEMRGLPYLEAGDALQITAEDGTIVNTYMMRREMSGIQALFDSVEAKGGEIIESVEVPE